MNEKNLKPFNKGQVTSEEAKKRGSVGGKRSAISRMKRKLMRDSILQAMNKHDWDEVINGIIQRAKTSDRGFIILRDILGQKPSQSSNTQPSENTYEYVFMRRNNEKE